MMEPVAVVRSGALLRKGPEIAGRVLEKGSLECMMEEEDPERLPFLFPSYLFHCVTFRKGLGDPFSLGDAGDGAPRGAPLVF